MRGAVVVRGGRLDLACVWRWGGPWWGPAVWSCAVREGVNDECGQRVGVLFGRVLVSAQLSVERGYALVQVPLRS